MGAPDTAARVPCLDHYDYYRRVFHRFHHGAFSTDLPYGPRSAEGAGTFSSAAVVAPGLGSGMARIFASAR